MSLERFKAQAIRDLNIYEATPAITNEEWIAFAKQLVASNSKTIAEAKNENGVCLYRYVASSNTDNQSFEKKFKALKKELEYV